jgi:ubiquinone/menaquinone biosynthesis C-methylase UbiE
MPYYDSIAGGYDELHKDEQLNKLSIIKKALSVKNSEKLLDVGCGTGISSDFDCFVAGIDTSLELLKLNKSKNKSCAAAESLPFKDNSFDYVISVTAMHNFKDIKKSIAEMKRVGKNKFIFSILKKSRKLDTIKKSLEKNFDISGEIEEEKDIIFFCNKQF